jgi:hypothetical protein
MIWFFRIAGRILSEADKAIAKLRSAIVSPNSAKPFELVLRNRLLTKEPDQVRGSSAVPLHTLFARCAMARLNLCGAGQCAECMLVIGPKAIRAPNKTSIRQF